MSSSNLTKNVLLSTNTAQVRAQNSDISSTDPCDLFENRLKFEHSIDYNIASLQVDAHKKRLKKLRKELTYLQDTAWKYQNIEKILVMYSVTVLTPRGRRQQVKVTPNTTLLQVLEEVCTKHGFNATEYDLRHHNQVLDVSSMFRFTSLPNNAQLEMTEAAKLRQDSPVILGLQLESGERLTGTFKPSDTIWHVISSLRPEEEKMNNLVVIYMRQEIFGRENLSSTTLRSLGLTGGRAMLRLLHKLPEELRTQANVTTNLVPRVVTPVEEATKAKQSAAPIQESNTKDTSFSEKMKVSNDKKNSLEKAKSPSSEEAKENSSQFPSKFKKSENYNFKGNIMEKLLKEEKASRKAALMDHAKVDPSENKNEMAPSSQKVNPVVTEKDETQNKEVTCRSVKRNAEPNGCKEETSKVVLLGERNAVAYNLNSVKPVEFEEEPEDFFDLTISDAKMLLKEAKQLCAELEDAPLMTAAQRELEKDKKVLSLLNQYKKTVLRVKFPDRTVLQGTFSPVETISEVEKFVSCYLENPKLKFYLYTTPPKVILKPEERLIECGCVPSSNLYLGLPGDVSMPSHFLNSDVLSKLSTPSAATLTALQSRGVEKKGKEKTDEGEKRKWAKSESSENPGPSGSTKGQATGKDQFKCPKWFKPNK